MSAPVPLKLETPAGALTALHWENEGAPRVLALHGWLDNAASFIPLAGCLEDLDLVALDFAGHGHSDHRPPGAHYYYMDYLFDVDAVMNALGWDDAALLGHSLGGTVACCYASARPERVRRIALLDGLGPLSGDARDAGPRLRRALAFKNRERGGLKTFARIDDAVDARLKATPMERDACRQLCERALIEVDGGWQWRTDSRLNWVSPTVLLEPQVLSILAGIEAPVLSVQSEPLPSFMDRSLAERRVAAVKQIERHVIEGHHHFHMEQAAEVCGIIGPFLAKASRGDTP